jgi:hypothetical protein
VIIKRPPWLKRAVWQVRAVSVNGESQKLTRVVEEKEAFHHCQGTDLLYKSFCFQSFDEGGGVPKTGEE